MTVSLPGIEILNNAGWHLRYGEWEAGMSDYTFYERNLTWGDEVALLLISNKIHEIEKFSLPQKEK